MTGFRLRSLLNARPSPDEVPAVVAPRAMLVLESDEGRAAFLEQARRELAAGECLVEIKDVASSRRAFETRPTDPRARLVAKAVPKLVRGRLLVEASYYVVPADSLDARETHFEAGEYSHHYDILLKPLVGGPLDPDVGAAA